MSHAQAVADRNPDCSRQRGERSTTFGPGLVRITCTSITVRTTGARSSHRQQLCHRTGTRTDDSWVQFSAKSVSACAMFDRRSHYSRGPRGLVGLDHQRTGEALHRHARGPRLTVEALVTLPADERLVLGAGQRHERVPRSHMSVMPWRCDSPQATVRGRRPTGELANGGAGSGSSSAQGRCVRQDRCCRGHAAAERFRVMSTLELVNATTSSEWSRLDPVMRSTSFGSSAGCSPWITSIPAAGRRRPATAFVRDPGTFVCAGSSPERRRGCREHRVESISSNVAAVLRMRGTISRCRSPPAVGSRGPGSRRRHRCRARRVAAFVGMANVFTPGAAPGRRG